MSLSLVMNKNKILTFPFLNGLFPIILVISILQMNFISAIWIVRHLITFLSMNIWNIAHAFIPTNKMDMVVSTHSRHVHLPVR